MNSRDNPFSEFLSLIKSWSPWRPDPSNLSRDFWMPDESCRVCYECDTQFAIIICRHHCRLCGRVFCGKCPANSIPTEYTNRQGTYDDQERVRVCNFCFKQWRQNLDAVKNEERIPDLESNTSPSAKSQSSPKSIKTSDSVYIALSHSVESPQHAQQSSNLISDISSLNEMSVDGKSTVSPGRSSYDTSGLADQPVPYPSQYGFPFSRNYVDGDHYDLYQSDSEAIFFPRENDYVNQHHLDDLSNNVSESFDMHDDHIKTKVEQGSVSHEHRRFDSHESNEFSQLNRKDEENFISDAASSTADGISSEPVDFENNGILWLLPEPEDEEDEKEVLLFDDKGDVTGEWGYLRASDSFGSGEFRNKDRSVEEQQRL